MLRGVIDIRARNPRHILPHRESRSNLTELEWSDYGRDPRFPEGWWIIPGCFLSLLSIWVLLS